MRSTLGLLGLLAALWLLSSGHYSFAHTLLLGFGAASCVGVLVLCRRMGIVDDEAVPVHLTLRGIAYIPWFVKEVALANVDVARRVLSPSLPISPCVFEAPPSQKTDLGRVLYANSITMTPGTVSLLVRDEAITVHAIAREAAEGVLSGAMDARVTRLEGA